MNNEFKSDSFILVAAPDQEFRNIIRLILEKEGLAVLIANSVDEVVSFMSSFKLCGLVITSDWAVAKINNTEVALMTIAKEKIPTITFITPNTWKQSNLDGVFDTVYDPPFHDYIHLPFAVSEMLLVLERIGVKKRPNRED
jgi:CheY-like chemotaxis protein